MLCAVADGVWWCSGDGTAACCSCRMLGHKRWHKLEEYKALLTNPSVTRESSRSYCNTTSIPAREERSDLSAGRNKRRLTDRGLEGQQRKLAIAACLICRSRWRTRTRFYRCTIIRHREKSRKRSRAITTVFTVCAERCVCRGADWGEVSAAKIIYARRTDCL